MLIADMLVASDGECLAPIIVLPAIEEKVWY